MSDEIQIEVPEGTAILMRPVIDGSSGEGVEVGVLPETFVARIALGAVDVLLSIRVDDEAQPTLEAVAFDGGGEALHTKAISYDPSWLDKAVVAATQFSTWPSGDHDPGTAAQVLLRRMTTKRRSRVDFNEKVRIARQYENTNRTLENLGKEYGVNKTTIHRWIHEVRNERNQFSEKPVPLEQAVAQGTATVTSPRQGDPGPPNKEVSE